MVSHISVKNSLLMLLSGLVCAAALVFLLNNILKGPRLGPHFDFLLKYKNSAVSREIVIINTGEYADSSDLYSVLITLTEMQASNLVMTAKMFSSSSPVIITEADIKRRFGDEYSLLGSNIRSLFESIRMGYLNPVQAPLFVEQVIDLAGQGRDRLISALVDRDDDLLRAVTVFANYMQADTVPLLDKDGKLRRVKPLDLSNEHPVFSYLKQRYAFSQIETSDTKSVLWLRSHDARDIDIPLDSDGNIIAASGSGFKSVSIDLFHEYDDTLALLRNLMEEANELKAFLFTTPEKIPLFIDDHAAFLLGELLMSPDSDNRYAWIQARENYFKSLDEFFTANAQELVINYYDELITEHENEEIILNDLIRQKNDVTEIFFTMREAYAKLRHVYDILKEELIFSFCVMGPWPNAHYSALLANTLITGSHVKPVDEKNTLIFSFTAVFTVLLITFYLRPVFLLPFGLLSSVLTAAIFTFIFFNYSYWIDPLIPFAASVTGVLLIFIIKYAYLNYRARSFRMAYRTAVSKDVLKNLIKQGRPRLSEINDVFAAVIAVKDINLLSKEDNEKSRDKGKARRSFYAAAKKAIFSRGAVITGYEGDTILVCFGSPVDKSYHPVSKACNFAREIIKKEKLTWRFGIDAGMCSFSWSQETGYCVSGRPAVRARVLVSKTLRLKAKALVTDNVLEKIHMDADKIGVIKDESGSFYELPLTNNSKN